MGILYMYIKPCTRIEEYLNFTHEIYKEFPDSTSGLSF